MGQIKTIDLHELSLWEAKDNILQAISQAYCDGELKIKFIHGYNRGTVIRDYLDSQEFVDDMMNEGIWVKNVYRQTNPGVTFVIIDLRQ